jgi:DNA-binding LytR/AlgR family response regulator
MNRPDLILIHISDSRRLFLDPGDVYYLEAVGDETLIRTRSARRLRDLRSIGEVLPLFEPFGFLRVHRNHAVNLHRVRELRRRKSRSGWELKLQSPVNRILPVSRNALSKLLDLFRK